MGTLSLDLTGFDASNPIPGIYAEARYAQGESGGDIGPKKVLIIGGKVSAGTITAGTQIVGPLSDEAEFETYAGAGSAGHRMGKRFLKLYKGAALYYVAYTTPAGSAAVDKLIITVGTITGGGVVEIVIAGETCSCSFSTSSTATTIGDAIAADINSRTWLPVTASNVTGTVTITAKAEGVLYNSIRMRAKCTANKGVSVNSSMTSDIAIGTSGETGAAIGVGTADYTTVCSTILGTKFHRIIVDSQVLGTMDNVVTQINLQAEPTTGYRQQMIAGLALTPSAAATLASNSAINAARARVINQEESPEEHYLTAATCGAVFCKHEFSDRSFNFDGYGQKEGQVFPLQRPYNDTAKPTSTELAAMLNSGVIPVGVNDGDGCYIVRNITTRCKNGSNNDYRVRDANIVTTGDAYTDDLVSKLAAKPWTHVTADPADGGDEPLPKFATPRRVKAAVEQHVSDQVDAGYLDPALEDVMLDAIQTGIHAQVKTRIDISNTIYAAKSLHQMGLLVKEASPAA